MTVVYTSPHADDPCVAKQTRITALQNAVAGTLTAGGPASVGASSTASLKAALAQEQNELAINLMNLGRLPGALIVSTLIVSTLSLSQPAGVSATQTVLNAIQSGKTSGAEILAVLS